MKEKKKRKKNINSNIILDSRTILSKGNSLLILLLVQYIVYNKNKINILKKINNLQIINRKYLNMK